MYQTDLRSVNVFSHKSGKSDRTNSLLKVIFLEQIEFSNPKTQRDAAEN